MPQSNSGIYKSQSQRSTQKPESNKVMKLDNLRDYQTENFAQNLKEHVPI